MNRAALWIQSRGPGVYGIVGMPGTGKSSILLKTMEEWKGEVYAIDPVHQLHLKTREVKRIEEGARIARIPPGSFIAMDEIDSWVLENPKKRWNWLRGVVKKARNLGLFVVWTSHSVTDVPYWARKSVCKGMIFGRLHPKDTRAIDEFMDRRLDRVFALQGHDFVLFPIADV